MPDELILSGRRVCVIRVDPLLDDDGARAVVEGVHLVGGGVGRLDDLTEEGDVVDLLAVDAKAVVLRARKSWGWAKKSSVFACARVQNHSWAGLKSSRIWDGEVRALGRGGDIGPRTHHVGRRDRGLEHLDRHRDERVGATLAALRKERGEGKCRVRGEREARF